MLIKYKTAAYVTNSLLLLVTLLSACNKHPSTGNQNDFSGAYSTSEAGIYHYNKVVQLIGANAFHIFSAGGSDMNIWHLDLSREFIGNVKEAPLSGGVIKDGNGAYLYPMQTVADSNRQNNRITVFCAFGWDGTAATAFTGLQPTQTSWWADYKSKLRNWALQFKDQPDVWLEVWNEPYRYDRTDGYTDEGWAADMNELVTLIRNTGNNNIILVPCAEQGQDESVLINKGPAFLTGKKNILFDIHAYEKWLLVPNNDMGNRLTQLKRQQLPVIFGEVAPQNASVLMDPAPFLDSVYNNGMSVCAWVWKYDASDADALLDSTGSPNGNQNNHWGSVFKGLSAKIRNP